MKKEKLVRATKKDTEKYLEILRNIKSTSKSFWLANLELKYQSMSDEEIYHHFMDHPVTDYGTFQIEVGESGCVPRLFRKGNKFISIQIPLKEIKEGTFSCLKEGGIK